MCEGDHVEKGCHDVCHVNAKDGFRNAKGDKVADREQKRVVVVEKNLLGNEKVLSVSDRGHKGCAGVQ